MQSYDGHTPIHEQQQPFNKDLEHLRLLSIFHYILGGIGALISLFPCIHLSIGILMVNGAFPTPPTAGGGPPVEVIGWFFIIFPAVIIVLGLTLASCVILTGRHLSNRSGYMFCLIIASFECLFMPFGTILGVFTFVVLFRPSVKVLFGIDPPPPQTPQATFSPTSTSSTQPPTSRPIAPLPVEPIEPPPDPRDS